MGRGHAPPSSSIDAQDLHRFFEEKINGVRASTASAAPPSFVSAPPDCEFSAFCALDVDDVIAAIHKLPDKQCAADPIPTRLLKDCADVLAPFVTELFNRCVSVTVQGSIHYSDIKKVGPGPVTGEVIPTHIESHRAVKDTRTTSRSPARRLLE